MQIEKDHPKANKNEHCMSDPNPNPNKVNTRPALPMPSIWYYAFSHYLIPDTRNMILRFHDHVVSDKSYSSGLKVQTHHHYL
jgi:hypothetical protein